MSKHLNPRTDAGQESLERETADEIDAAEMEVFDSMTNGLAAAAEVGVLEAIERVTANYFEK